MRATSFRRTVEPSVLARSTTLPNCSAFVSWPCTTMVADTGWPCVAGRSPRLPADTCTFCARMAAVTWSIDRLKPLSLDGSTQTRMARSAPNCVSVPTPATRCSSGTTLRAA